MGNEPQKELTAQDILELVHSWLYDPSPLAPTEDAPPVLIDIVNYLNGMRQVLQAFSTGNIDHPVGIRGYMGGHLKGLQANLRHLAWQARMVAMGDLRQRVSFMGEFSSAFNEMVAQLQANLKEIAANRDQLAELNEALLRRIKRQEINEENLKRSEKHFRRLAITDSLTGALTRQHFFVTASLEMARTINEKGQMCVLMIDVDHFKQVNDNYGHLVGDQVLKGLSGRFKTALRERDVLARYGGEEFIVMLPRASREVGIVVAERLRQGVDGHPIATNGGVVKATVSVGGVYFATESSSSKISQKQIEPLLLNMINFADLALYQAKNQGRNQVVFGGPENGDFGETINNSNLSEASE